jgi:hypothetical protein
MKALHYERYFFITTTLMRLSPPFSNYFNAIKLQLQPIFCKNIFILLIIIKIINYYVLSIAYNLFFMDYFL